MKINLIKGETCFIDEVMKIEEDSFEQGIREDRSVFEERIKVFKDGFWLIKANNLIVGYFASEIWNKNALKSLKNLELNHSISDFHDNNGNILYISSLGINSKFRGINLGKKLFSDSISKILDNYKNINKIRLIVSNEWTSARSLYEKMGFIEKERINNFFSTKKDQKKPLLNYYQDGLIMEKELL